MKKREELAAALNLPLDTKWTVLIERVRELEPYWPLRALAKSVEHHQIGPNPTSDFRVSLDQPVTPPEVSFAPIVRDSFVHCERRFT